jgi:hypothetical protein
MGFVSGRAVCSSGVGGDGEAWCSVRRDSGFNNGDG